MTHTVFICPVITADVRDAAATICAINASTRPGDDEFSDVSPVDFQASDMSYCLADLAWRFVSSTRVHRDQPRAIEGEAEALLRTGWAPKGAWFNAAGLFLLEDEDNT